MTGTVVLLRCPCHYALVLRRDARLMFCFGEITIYEDTMKVVARCRRCERVHTLTDGSLPESAVSMLHTAFSIGVEG